MQADLFLCQSPAQNEALDAPSILEEMEMVTKPKVDWKWWVTTGLVVLGLVSGATWKIAEEFSNLDKHIGRVETAVRIIGAKQGGDTKALVDEALTIASNDSKAGRVNGAASTLAIANRLLKEQAEEGIALSSQDAKVFFIQYQNLKSLAALRQTAHEGMLELADYRSTSVPMPPSYTQADFDMHNGVLYIHDGVLSGAHTVVNGPNGFDISRVLMKNVVLRNVDIYYHGGPLHLENVTFINCHFDVTDSPGGDHLLEAAIESSGNVQFLG